MSEMFIHRTTDLDAVLEGAAARWVEGAGRPPTDQIAFCEYERNFVIRAERALYAVLRDLPEAVPRPRLPEIVRGEHVVYRAYADNDDLLYVGLTSRFGDRMREHHSGSIWWPSAARITAQVFPSREEAAAGERVAIVTEWPTFNGTAR